MFFEIVGYSVHSYYILFFLFFISLLPDFYLHLKKRSAFSINTQDLIKRYFAFFLLIFFFINGGYKFNKKLHFFNGDYPIQHALIYYSLAIFTLLIFSPTIVYFHQKERERVQNIIIFFLLIQSLILIYDFIISNLQYSKFAIGHYIGNSYYTEDFYLYRPHFLEQEPAYLSVYTLFLLAYLRIKIIPNKRYFNIGKKRWNLSIPTFSIYFLVALSIITTTSKTGTLGVVAFIFYEIILFIFKNKKIKNPFEDFWNKKTLLVNISILLLTFFIFFRFLYVFDGYYLNRFSFFKQFNISEYYFDTYAKKKINSVISNDIPIKISTYLSLNLRKERFLNGYEIFKNYPILGVGINASYYVYYHYFNKIPKEDTNKPLSFNLYTELLSEWGLLGAVLFLIALLFFIRQKSILDSILILCLFLIIAISSENLIRFNLWFSLALLYNHSYHSRKDNNRIK